jgi:F-type H+-transporting ATPase subunit epsilon
MQIVVVTPEKAILDEKAEFIVLPMMDGELGVQPGRAALVGRLGQGELRLTQGGQVKKYQLKGGFAQVRNNVVTVLTSQISIS